MQMPSLKPHWKLCHYRIVDFMQLCVLCQPNIGYVRYSYDGHKTGPSWNRLVIMNICSGRIQVISFKVRLPSECSSVISENRSFHKLETLGCLLILMNLGPKERGRGDSSSELQKLGQTGFDSFVRNPIWACYSKADLWCRSNKK